MGPDCLYISPICKGQDQWEDLCVSATTSFAFLLTSFAWLSFISCGAVGWVVRLSLRFPIAVKILKVLGEGGFSFVYLCQDEASGVSPFIAPPGYGIDDRFSEGIRFEEDQVSNWFGRCETGYEGSGGL